MRSIALALLLLSMSSIALCSSEQQICLYQTEQGIVQVNSLNDVPEKYRASAQCIDVTKATGLAKPEDISLTGLVRHEQMSTSVGRIDLRWPRKVENLFGRTPQRAMAEAARTVSRTLKQGGFPNELRDLNLDWKVVFLDEELPSEQIPAYLVSNCHPGWMTPPANIYLVGQRIVAGCSGGTGEGSRVNDAQLTQTILHEMGHAVEYAWLGFGAHSDDRMRKEGFASWFEQFSSDYSSVAIRGAAEQQYKVLARTQISMNPGLFQFSGSAADYGRASMYFVAIVDKRRVYGLARVYETMKNDKLQFFPAVKKALGWDLEKLEEEVRRVLR